MGELLVGEWVRVRLPGYEPFIGIVTGRRSNGGGLEVIAERGATWLVQDQNCRRVRREWVEID